MRAVGFDVATNLGWWACHLLQSGGAVACGDWASAATVTLYWNDFSGGGFPVQQPIATAAGACPQPTLRATVTVTWTGLKLVTQESVSGGLTYVEYAYWADSPATRVVTITGNAGTYSATTSYAGSLLRWAQFLGRVQADVTLNMTGFAGTAVPLADGITTLSVSWDGQSDPSQPRATAFRGTSNAVPGILTAAFYDIEPPMQFGCDVRVETAAGAAPARDVLVANLLGQGVTVTNPATGAFQYWYPADSGGSPGSAHWIQATLSGVWAEHGIEPVARDLLLHGLAPKRPTGAPEYRTVATLAIASPVDVLLSANVWTKTGSVALSGTGNSTWTVTGAGTVSRALAGTYPSADSYTTTKHALGDDVWGWGLYAYLSLSLTASVPATLTLTITYNTDPSTGATTTRTYTFAVVAGTQTVRLDLLFPDAATEPDYWERATNLSLAGFANGAYTLNSCQLVADQAAYVKVASAGDAFSTYPGLTLALDGSMPAYWWGANPIVAGVVTRKDDECGYAGGANLTLGGSVRMDGTLAALVAELSRMEGLTAVLDTTALAADLTDGTNVFGNLTAADYLASWIKPQMQARLAAGGTLYLEAAPRFHRAIVPPLPAGRLILPFRATLGMVLEALCLDAGGARAGAGFPIVARRSATGVPNPADPVIGGGATDASGFVSVPIPTGQVGGAEFYAYPEGT